MRSRPVGFVRRGCCTSLLHLVGGLTFSVNCTGRAAGCGKMAPGRWGLVVGGVAGQEGSGGGHSAVKSSAAIPPMPVIGLSEQDRSVPYPLLDGLKLTIGWHFRGQSDSGAAFVILRRRWLRGTFEVIESFPLTEDGWAQAWQSLANQDPEAARKVANKLDAGILTTDGGTTHVSPPYKPSKAARKMRHELQKALNRPVILPNERRFDQAKRTVVHRRKVIIGLGILGASIASVITGGVATPILAITAASLPIVDYPTFFDINVPDPNLAITLEQDAVAALLDITDVEQRVKAVQAAINKKRGTGADGRWTLSRADITPERLPVPGSRIDLVRAGVKMGLTVIAAGLLLLALTLIPHDIHGLTTRAASVMLIVGALIVGYAMADGGWPKRS
jgi:hypothetical protein